MTVNRNARLLNKYNSICRRNYWQDGQIGLKNRRYLVLDVLVGSSWDPKLEQFRYYDERKAVANVWEVMNRDGAATWIR
jgi:hypothetical protein